MSRLLTRKHQRTKYLYQGSLNMSLESMNTRRQDAMNGIKSHLSWVYGFPKDMFTNIFILPHTWEFGELVLFWFSIVFKKGNK